MNESPIEVATRLGWPILKANMIIKVGGKMVVVTETDGLRVISSRPLPKEQADFVRVRMSAALNEKQ